MGRQGEEDEAKAGRRVCLEGRQNVSISRISSGKGTKGHKLGRTSGGSRQERGRRKGADRRGVNSTVKDRK